FVRKWREQDVDDQAENQGTSADSEAKSDDRNKSESAALPKRTQGVPQIASEIFERSQRAHLAAILFQHADVAKLTPRRGLRIVVRLSLRHKAIGQPVEMFAQFVVEFAVTRRSTKKGAHSGRKGSHPRHFRRRHRRLLLFETKYTSHDPRNPLPIFLFDTELPFAPRRNRIELRLPVVVGDPPLRLDPALLQQPQQRCVD